MVLCLKTWESRSSPGLPSTEPKLPLRHDAVGSRTIFPIAYCRLASDAGWSSPVARQAHNLKAAGSNPAPATSVNCRALGPKGRGLFFLAERQNPGELADELDQ